MKATLIIYDAIKNVTHRVAIVFLHLPRRNDTVIYKGIMATVSEIVHDLDSNAIFIKTKD